MKNNDNIQDISVIKSKRKWKQIASKLNQPELENEEEESNKFNVNLSAYNNNQYKRRRYDEFGTEFTPFNMHDEMEEGDIDQSGNYLFNNKKLEYDPWYDSVKTEAKIKEIELKKNVNDDAESVEIENVNDEIQFYGEEDLYYKKETISKEVLDEINIEIKLNRLKLVDFLTLGETVSQALLRLKPKSIKKDLKKHNKKQKIELEIESESLSDNKGEEFKELLEIISKLTELSYFDVYSDTKKKIEKSYGYKSLLKWNYKTIINEKDKEPDIVEYGPFYTYQIRSWIDKKLLEETDNMKIEFKILNLENNENNNWLSRESPVVHELLSL